MSEKDVLEYLEPQRVRDLVASDKTVVIVDVRSPEEYARGHIDGAINIPADEVVNRVDDVPETSVVVTVCGLGGRRSTEAAKALKTLGREGTMVLKGGMRGWLETE